jgi:DNA repair protein SbcC/Rad50
LKDGVNAGKFAKYSGGQKMKISLAGMMTLQRLMNESLNGKGLNILCCDETLDFLDVTGTKMCLDMLQKIDTPTMIVSHNQIENLITDYNKISVFYKNRTSTVKYE